MIHDIKDVVDTWSMLSDLGWPLWDHPFSSSHLHGYKIDKFDQLRNLFFMTHQNLFWKFQNIFYLISPNLSSLAQLPSLRFEGKFFDEIVSLSMRWVDIFRWGKFSSQIMPSYWLILNWNNDIKECVLVSLFRITPVFKSISKNLLQMLNK